MIDVKAGFKINPQSTALVVIDMQRFCLEEGRSFLTNYMGIEMLPRLKNFMQQMRARAIPIFYTQGVCRADGSDVGVLGELFPGLGSEPFNQEGTENADIHPQLRPEPGDVVITKRRFSAFYGTDLELLLRTQGINTLIFTGVNTNICVESTARDAFFRDFRVVLVSDLTGTIPSVDGSMSAQQVQEATIKMFDGLYGFAFSAAEVLARIQG